MKSMRIVFFGTSNVALPVLENLSRQHEIVAVVTRPDAKVGRSQELSESPVSVLANEMKIKVLKPEMVKNNNIFRLELQDLNADIFVVVSYGHILPLEIINIPRLKTLNVHFSLLPKYRGASPIQAALLNGETETGTSIFILDEKMDRGPILRQEKIAIDPDDNFLSLSEKLAALSGKIIVDTIYHYDNGDIKPIFQDENSATYCKTLSKADGKIDWSKTALEIYNQFRAFFPWPGVWTEWNKKKVKVLECIATNPDTIKATNAYEFGQVLENGAVLCGQNTFLQINSLQLEGKKETKIADFLNGYSDFVGSKLN